MAVKSLLYAASSTIMRSEPSVKVKSMYEAEMTTNAVRVWPDFRSRPRCLKSLGSSFDSIPDAFLGAFLGERLSATFSAAYLTSCASHVCLHKACRADPVRDCCDTHGHRVY